MSAALNVNARFSFSAIVFVLFWLIERIHGLQKSSIASGTSQVGLGQTNKFNLKNKDHEDHNHHIYQRHFKEDDWLNSLIWNLIGYSTILIPGILIVRMAKYSNFNERDGKGCILKTAQFCIFGTPEEGKNDIEVGLGQNVGSQQKLFARNGLKLLFCAVGLQASYLTWGVLQERVMTKKYGKDDNAERFKVSEFLVFMNRLSAMLLSAFCLMIKRQGKHGSPFYLYSYSSLSNILSSWCQYEALKYVNFPTQVLGKASKMIPVMLMGKFVSRKTYQYYEYFIAGMISIGVSLFLLSVASGKNNSAQTSFSGLCLMVGYMLFDSFTSNWQSKIINDYKLTSLQVMFGTNVFSSMFTGVSLIQNGGMLSSISFIYQYPDFGYHASVISIASAVGQLFIFYTIASFGPLVFTCIMVTRQMFSMLLSCIIYRHYLAPQAILGILVVFFALILQIYAKWRVRSIKQRKPDAVTRA